MTDRELGVLFSVFDGDEKHFDRFLGELHRLGRPFVVNFDHCSRATKKFFMESPLYLGGYEDDDPGVMYSEGLRDRSLRILLREGFRWMLQLDVDETLDKYALPKLEKAVTMDADVIGARWISLWEREDQQRTDGGIANAKREKLFNLKANPKILYNSAVINSPRLRCEGRDPVVVMSDIFVLHWGMMSFEDADEHKRRWDTIYTKAVGGNPYGAWNYMCDRTVKVTVDQLPEEIR